VHAGTIDPLGRDEELALLCRWQEHGDPDARDRLVRANLRFVNGVAVDCVGRGVDFDELVALGAEGLLVAIDRFDLASGCKLITYAVWWIRQRILVALGDARCVRVSAAVTRTMAPVRRRQRQLEQRFGRAIPLEQAVSDLVDEGRLSANAATEFLRCLTIDTALEAGISAERLERTALAADGAAPDPQADAERAELVLAMRQLVDRLPPRTREWMYDHYGWYGRERLTLDEIGKRSGVSRERVRQVINNGRETLALWVRAREYAEAQRLSEMIEAA
jgi:RNA polymerase primary sigma factor